MEKSKKPSNPRGSKFKILPDKNPMRGEYQNRYSGNCCEDTERIYEYVAQDRVCWPDFANDPINAA
jgi:hypothetical protein